MIINTYYKNTNNLGDCMSAPHHYIKELGDYMCDVRYLDRYVEFIETGGGKIDAIVFGGGGIIHHDSYIYFTNPRIENYKKLIIGIGNNMRTGRPWEYPEWLDGFDYVGLRDPDNPYTWLPCASCLSEEFGDIMFKGHGWVCYSHYDHLIPNTDNLPMLTNKKTPHEFSGVIEFFRKAEFVISNSWHGVYWAKLLGKQVEVYEPFGNRFDCFLPEHEELWTHQNCVDVYEEEIPKIMAILKQ